MYWAWISRFRRVGGRKRVSKEVRALIFQMVFVNPTWGAPRIHGELLKLGFDLLERSVSPFVAFGIYPPYLGANSGISISSTSVFHGAALFFLLTIASWCQTASHGDPRYPVYCCALRVPAPPAVNMLWHNIGIALGQRRSAHEKLKSIILRVVEVRNGGGVRGEERPSSRAMQRRSGTSNGGPFFRFGSAWYRHKHFARKTPVNFDVKLTTKGTPMNVGSVITQDPMVDFREGIKLLKNKYPQKALVRFMRAFESDKHNAYYISFLGLAIARAQRKWAQASDLCETAVQLNPKEIQFHLNLGEVYTLAGRREQALGKLERALRLFGDDARLVEARGKVEKRRAPVLPFFGRGHFLNRELGKLRHRILKSFDK